MQRVLFDFALQAAYRTLKQVFCDDMPYRKVHFIHSCPQVEQTWMSKAIFKPAGLKIINLLLQQNKIGTFFKIGKYFNNSTTFDIIWYRSRSCCKQKSGGFASQFFEQRTSWCQQGHSGCFEGEIGDA